MATAGYLTPQQLRDGSVDAKTLDKFGNDPAGVPNINRVGNDVENMMTLRQRMLDAASDVANRKTYVTVAAMMADTSQPIDTPARVETGAGAGDYIMTASGWVWSDVQPASSARLALTETTVADVRFRTSGVSARARSRNILDLNAGISGSRVNTSTGGLMANAAYWASAYINISPSAQYKSSYGSSYAMYDENLAFIAGGSVSSGTNTFSTAANAAFVRLDYALSSLSTQMLALAAEYPASFDPFVEETAIENMAYDTALIIGKMERGPKLTPQAAGFFTNRSVNLLNPATNTPGKRINSANGALLDYALGSASDFIPVLPGVTYTRRGSNYYAEYDAEFYFVRGQTSGSPSTFTTASNTRYVRVTVSDAEAPTYMLVQGAALPADFSPYDPSMWLSGVKVDSSEDRIDEGRAGFLSRVSPNLLDGSRLVPGKRVNQANGALLDYPNNSASGYIPVEGGADYAFTEANYYAEYDEKHVFVYGAQLAGVFSITTQPTTRYVRMTIRDVVRDRFMFVAGPAVPNVYTPYDSWALTPNIVQGARWAGKKWNVFGDSVIQDQLSWWRAVSQQLAFGTARNYGIGGTAFAYRDAPEGVPNPELWTEQYFANRVLTMDDDADLITIHGGNNDFRQVPLGQMGDATNNTFYGAVRLTCERLAEKYPDRFVGFMTPLPHRNMHLTDANGKSWWDFVDAILETCARYSFPVLDMSRGTQLRFYNAASRLAFSRQTVDYPNGDGIHPNALGYATLEAMTRKWLLQL